MFVKLLLAAILSVPPMLLAAPQAASAAVYKACNGTSRPTLRYSDRGSCVTRAQQLLTTAGTLRETPNGVFGPATRTAVIDFQSRNGLASDGIIGPRTWRVLDGTANPAASTGSNIRPIANSTSTSTPAIPRSCQGYSGKAICVAKGNGSRATLYALNGGSVVRSMPARTGDSRPGDSRASNYDTDNGSFRVQSKRIDHVSSIYNAPMPYSLFYNGGEAIHYSSDFANDPNYRSASHGCVNLRSRSDARWLFNWTPKGTPVIVVPQS